MSNLVKKIDKLLLYRFIITFISLFSLILFILVIQQFFILFKDIAGKGLGVDIYAKIWLYLGLLVFPDTFPIAVLVTSLLVFEHLSKNYELTAMHSVGLSLQRIFRVPFLLVLFISAPFFYFQCYIHPTITPKIFNLMTNVMKKKSSLFIQQGIFCNTIPGYNILVKKKLDNRGTMQGITVYDYTKQHGKILITTAQKGRLYTTKDDSCLIMELINGYNYIKPLAKKTTNSDNIPNDLFFRNHFSNQQLTINLDALKLDDTNHRHQYEDPRIHIQPQLTQIIQSLKQELIQQEHDKTTFLKKSIATFLSPSCPYPMTLDSQPSPKSFDHLITKPHTTITSPFRLFINHLKIQPTSSDKTSRIKKNYTLIRHVLYKALHSVIKTKNVLIQHQQEQNNLQEKFNNYLFEQKNRLATAVKCIIAFLLAAPLGCIIRKGGFGIAIIIIVVFLIVEYVMSTLGKEYAQAGVLSAYLGAWLANLMLLPLCYFFLMKAIQGTDLSDNNTYYNLSLSIKKFFKNIPHRFTLI